MRWLTAIISVALLLGACRRQTGTSDKAAPEVLTDVTRAAELWADSVLAGMSVEERVGQLFLPATFTVADEQTVQRLLRYVADDKIGGVVFLKGDTASMRALTQRLNRASRIPLFLAIDAEWGLGMRLSDAPSYPHNSRLSGSTDQQMYDYGFRVGRDASRMGLNMVLGPVLDVASSGQSVMSDRSFGSDPAVVSSLGCSYARGLRDAGIVPVAKHFPGHGATTTDSHRALPVVSRTKAELETIDLRPFRDYVELEFPALMAGHVAMPALSGDSLPASVSRRLLTDLLREHMGFRGLIITDAMNMGALSDDRVYLRSVKAGADLILVPEDTRRAEQELIEALRTGELSSAEINDRARRILLYKYLLLNP